MAGAAKRPRRMDSPYKEMPGDDRASVFPEPVAPDFPLRRLQPAGPANTLASQAFA